MDFALAEEQQDVVAAFDQVLSKVSSIERVRAVESSGWDAAVWESLVQVGAPDFVGADPDAEQGRAVELALTAELLGRHLACVPFVGFAAAREVLRETGPAASDVDGSAPDRIAVFTPRPADRGVAPVVAGGAVAAALIVLDGDELLLVRDAQPAPVQDIGFQGAATWRVQGDGVERTVLATGESARQAWERGLAWWRIGAGAQSVGIAQRALEIAVEYAKVREQFGVPIGSFQALQHSLAEVLLEAEGARHFVRETAWRADQGSSGWEPLAAAAYAFAAEAATRAAERCLHVHGGYGYTLDYDAQLYLRRAKAIQLQGGEHDDIWTAVGAATMAGEI